MANILEFLRGVLTDPETQRAFRTDPAGFLDRAGFADLTGEDVVEGVLVLRRSLPDDTAKALAPFEDEDDLPPVRPAHDEHELDAAVRVLGFAVEQVPLAATAPEPEPEPEVEPEAEVATESAEAAEVETAGVTEAPPPMEVESELEVAPSAAASVPPVVVDTARLPSVGAFAESLAAAAADTRSRFDEVIQRFVDDAAAQAQGTADRHAAILRQAETDANAIRSAADEECGQLRADAEADRAAAQQVLERTRGEADQLLQRARQEADDVRRQAHELLAASRAEAEAIRQDLEARKVEMREAERQLKERLTGIDSLFRTVLRDDGDPAGPPA